MCDIFRVFWSVRKDGYGCHGSWDDSQNRNNGWEEITPRGISLTNKKWVIMVTNNLIHHKRNSYINRTFSSFQVVSRSVTYQQILPSVSIGCTAALWETLSPAPCNGAYFCEMHEVKWRLQQQIKLLSTYGMLDRSVSLLSCLFLLHCRLSFIVSPFWFSITCITNHIKAVPVANMACSHSVYWMHENLLKFRIMWLLITFVSTLGRHPWFSGSALDCWPTGRAIDPAPGAWFIPKFTSFAQVVSGPV